MENKQVRPKTEGWTQRKDAEGKPLLQFAEVKRGTAAADRAREEAARLARQAAHDAEMKRWRAYLVARTGGIKDWSGEFCTGKMIEALGGFKAARAGYAEHV